MSKFYFTYGSCSSTQPFDGGWTEVEADDARQAINLFKAVHPLVNGLIPCCSVALTEEEMRKGSDMLKHGNFGKFCQERISINHDVIGHMKEVRYE